MTSALELVSPIQQIQYPAKRFLAPLPLSLFGELEDESNGSFEEQSSSTPGQAESTATSTDNTCITSPSALVNGDDDEDEFGDFEDEFGDFESVPAGTTGVIEATSHVEEPSPSLTPNLLSPQAAQSTGTGTGKPAEVTRDFLADFGAVAVSPAPTIAPIVAKSKPVVEEDLFGNFGAVTGVPQIEVSSANRPFHDFFGNFESPAITQADKDVTRKPAQDTFSLFEDFSSLSANGTQHVEPSGTASAANEFEGFGPGVVRTVQIEPTVVRNNPGNLFEDFGSDTYFDVPKRGPMNGFEDLFGDFEAPPPVNTHTSWVFLNQSLENGLGPDPKGIVVNVSKDSEFDPLGVSQFNSPEQNLYSRDVIFFSPRAQANSQGTGALSDDDWGDFVAPPPPVTSFSVKATEVVSNDPFTVGSGDFFTNGGLGDFSLPNRASQSPETQSSTFLDSWETEFVDSGEVKSSSIYGNGTLVSDLETISDTPAHPAPVKVDASSFYESQVSQFFPTSSSAKPRKDGDSRRSRSVDLDALYANPSPVVKINNRAKSSVEHSAAPLSLSFFGEEEEPPQESPELPSASSLNEFFGSERHHDAENGDGGLSSSSESQEDTDVDADEFFLANEDDLHKLTLWLLEEGRVQEALACTSHTAALLEFQALQEDCSRALESGDRDRASVITSKIEAAHAKLAKPQEWHRWQKRQRHENGFKHGTGTTPIVPKLTYEDMMSLLGGISDPRGVYFRSHFQSHEIDSLAKEDLRAAAERHTRALETFRLLISATVQEQLLYVKAWSALASSCASELELGMIFWQRAVQAQSQSHLLTHRKGRNYFAALGQVYSVFLILDATARLHAPWLEVAGEKGKAIHRLVDQCRSYWVGSGLKDAVYWALSEANDSLPSTRTSWQGILDLSIAVNLATLKHSKAGTEPVCGLSLLPLQTLPGDIIARNLSSLDSCSDCCSTVNAPLASVIIACDLGIGLGQSAATEGSALTTWNLNGRLKTVALNCAGMATVDWGGRQYFLPLANMWANCVEAEPPRLPLLGLQQSV